MSEKNSNMSPLEKSFKIKIPYTDIKSNMDLEFDNLSKSLKIPGFRPGKVPISFVKNKYFKDVISRTSEKLIQEEGNKTIEKNKYRLAVPPKVKLLSELKENIDLEAEFHIEVLPAFKINDFSKITLNRYISSVTDQDVNNVIKKLHNDNKVFKKAPPEREAKKNDRLLISYKGFIEKEQFEGGSAENQIIDLGNNAYLPEFEKNLLGKKLNDKFELEILFPKSYHVENLREKKATFKISINEISIPELMKDDKDLAIKMGAKTVEELKTKITNELEKYSEELSFAIMKNQIIKNIVSNYNFDLPPSLVLREKEIIKKSIKREKEDNKEKNKKIEEKIRKEAENKVKIGIVLSEMGIQNKVNVTNQEIETELARICMQYPGKEKEIVEYYKNNPAQMNSLKSPIFENKVIKLIAEKASVKEEKISSEELNSKISSIEKEMTSN
jgi:trigger factor